MRWPRLLLVFLASVIFLVGLPYAAPMPLAQAHGGSHISVTTRSYNNLRTGANLQETLLTTANVRPGSFGKIYSRDIDGQMYAQPLYLPDLAVPGKGTHNVVFVATANNNVYAFDADDPAAAMPLWQVNLGQYAQSLICDPSCSSDFGYRYNFGQYRDIQPNVGIIGTPVIDANTGTLYVVTFERLGTARPFTYRHRLHALDVASGAQKPNSPIVIQATYQGNSGNSVNGVLTFNSRQQLQRPALTLLNGVIYIAFASYADTDPYYGWLLGYDAATLQQRYVFNTTPTKDSSSLSDGEGGIWMSGQGLSADANGDLYMVVGNGNYNANIGGNNYGNSVLRLRTPTSGIRLDVRSFFTPYNWDYLNDQDLDLGVTGATLIPNTNYLVAGSKEGKLYLLDRTNLSGLSSNDEATVQSFLATRQINYHIHGSPVYWNSPTGGRLYLQSEQDRLRVFSFNGSRFNPTPAMVGSFELATGMPGGIVSLSANGSTPGSGIVWVTTPYKGQSPDADANAGTRPGELRAYDASGSGSQDPIWSSSLRSNDDLGNFAKFNPPLIVDGKVFVGDFGVPDDPTTSANEFHQDKLVVYGLLAPSVVTPAEPATLSCGQPATLEVTATGAGPLIYQWYAGESGDENNPVVGATSSLLTISSLVNSSRYWVKITNSYGTVNSDSTLLNINPAATTLTLAALPVRSSLGQPVTLKAQLAVNAPSNGQPSGTVTFRDGGTVLGIVPIASDGNALLVTTALTPGNHVIGATYAGPSCYSQSSATDVQLTVEKIGRIWVPLVSGP